MTIGERIQRRREQLKLTQLQLAKSARVTRSAISQIESGRTKGPKPEHLVAIAEALGLRVETLVKGQAPHAAEPASTYNRLSEDERTLIDYIRATGSDDAQRQRLARVALQLLLAIGTDPVSDDKLGATWTASRK